jgi:methylenetetrahydrofolate reductase (NADPH)
MMKKATTLSIELFPPKDQIGEDKLWIAIEELRAFSPDFVSVTYGAGGSTRDRTIRIAEELTSRTGIPTVAHLTCVGSTREELSSILNHYKSAGISSILALRGDPTGGPRAAWEVHSGGLNHAEDLVEMARERGDFTIGVAAFPDGHPASNGNFDQDIDVLLRKESKGASFATTQFFFEYERYEALVEGLASKGSSLPIVAGILPITNIKQLTRMAELSGTPIPSRITQAFEGYENSPEDIAKIGIDFASELSQKLLDAKVPGLHFYTMNTSRATLQVVANLGISRGI